MLLPGGGGMTMGAAADALGAAAGAGVWVGGAAGAACGGLGWRS